MRGRYERPVSGLGSSWHDSRTDLPRNTLTPMLIRLRGVAARIGRATILRDVDLDVAAGESVALYGANGAGKTTVLRVLATLLAPAAGSVEILGENASNLRSDVRRRIGLIGHQPALYPELSLRANLFYVADVVGIPRSSAEAALTTVGLAAAADRTVEQASYGMARRCEIARELMLSPEVLLLDEPHSALDESAIALVTHLVDDVTARNGCVVVASHDRHQVDKITGRQLLIDSGTIS